MKRARAKKKPAFAKEEKKQNINFNDTPGQEKEEELQANYADTIESDKDVEAPLEREYDAKDSVEDISEDASEDTLEESQHIDAEEIAKKFQEYSDKVMKQTPPKKKPVKKKKKKGRILKKVICAIFALIIISFIAMGFGIFDGTPLGDGKINVLLVGVDEEGLHSDAIMVASYDVKAEQVNLLSVPRDTKVTVENRNVTRKITEAHAMTSKKDNTEIVGVEAVSEIVTQLTGMPIDYYVEFSFLSIDHLFDILGPVEFDVPDVEGKGRGMNYHDPYQNLAISLKPGLQKLSGNQVQQFLRYRKSDYRVGTGSDTDRVARQHDFLKAVVDQKVNASLLVKLPSIYAQLTKEIKTNITVADITKYVRYLNRLSGEAVHTYSLPGDNKMIGGKSYFVCDTQNTAALMSEVFGYNKEISDKVTISDDCSQKVIKAGNMKKQKAAQVTKAPKMTMVPMPETTKKPINTPEPEEEKAPVVTKSPTKAPAVTKAPLEDLDDDFEVVD